MLHVYHESEKEETNLDSKPLLGDLKLAELFSSETRPIYVNECCVKKASAMSDSYQAGLISEVALDENENLVEAAAATLCGLYVAAFDTRRGNVIEWQIPESLDLDNVEFKAMASGFHLMENDLVYFCKDGMYSLAVFQILRSDDARERNVRMKSVGVLGRSFKQLRSYVPVLRAQIK